MPTYTYKALDRSGSLTTGEVEAHDRGQALHQLSQKGLQPVKVIEKSGGAAGAKSPGGKKAKSRGGQAQNREQAQKGGQAKGRGKEKVPEGNLKLKRAEVVLFTEELSDMLAAGLQLEPALRAMENRQELGNLQAVSERVRTLVRDGGSFSQSLKRVSSSFGPLYCSLAAAGEASGALPTILQRQAEYLKTLQELQNRVTLALIYPAFLVLSGIAVAIIFITKLIPQLTELLSSTGSKIPLGARLMIGASDFLSKWWLPIVLVIVAAAVAFKAWKDMERNRPTWDRIKLNLPLVGPVIRGRFYVQFLETMANLIGNGLPLLRSLELTREAAQNLHIRSAMDGMIEEVGDGRALSRAMTRSGIFTPLLIDMVSVGEQTGKIDSALRRTAERFDKELDNSLQRVMALIMPAVLLLMAVLVGSMAYLMISAIFQTIQNISG